MKPINQLTNQPINYSGFSLIKLLMPCHPKPWRRKAILGFSLIELLVVISIIGILIGLSIFGLQGAKASSRDAKRKSDIEVIRSGVEMYKSDCGSYPIKETAGILPSPLVGDLRTYSCSPSNTYIAQMPIDSQPSLRNYIYFSADGLTYEICASLEQGSSTAVTCGSTQTCGPCSRTGDCVCNYKAVSP